MRQIVLLTAVLAATTACGGSRATATIAPSPSGAPTDQEAPDPGAIPGDTRLPGDERFLIQAQVGDDFGATAGEAAVAADEAALSALSADGRTLFLLDAQRGLQIVDLSDLSAPVLAGRVAVAGRPVGLHLRGAFAYVTLSDTVTWARAADGGLPTARVGSQLWTIDLTTPAAPRVVSRVDADGALGESRLGASVLYAVSRRGGAWGPDGARTPDLVCVSSFDLADPASPRPAARLEVDVTGATVHTELTERRLTLSRSGGDGAGGRVTRFQVYDLSDPAGAVTAGAGFEAAGELLESRAMHHDQDRGVFGAVLGQGPGGGATLVLWSSPTAATAARVGSASLAQGETLGQARLDDGRAYVVTTGSGSRLHVVDATDPARPLAAARAVELRGEVVSIEPDRARLLALTSANAPGTPWELSLSLVDAAGADGPELLGSTVVGQEPTPPALVGGRARKGFQVLGDQALVTVPAFSWDGTARAWVPHVTLVDLAPRAITARGRMRHALPGARASAVPGQPGQLALRSAGRLSIVDAKDHGAPRERASLDLSDAVSALAFAGGAALELEGDGDGAELRVLPAPDLGAVPLARLGVEGAWRVHEAGSVLWVLGRELTAVDVADPRRPRSRGALDLVAASAEAGGAWGCQAEYAFLGAALLVHRIVACGPGDARSGHDLLVVDLSAPDAPRLAARLALPGDRGWGLTVAGDHAWTMRWEPEPGQPGWGRYFADLIALPDPAVPTLRSVNVPGIVVGGEPGGTRLYACEPVTRSAAGAPPSAGTVLHALELTAHGTARLAASAEVTGAHGGVVLTGGRAYLATAEARSPAGPSRLAVVQLASMRVLSERPVASVPVVPRVAAGGKLFLSASDASSYPHRTESVIVLGLGDPDRPAFEQAVQASGWVAAGASAVVEGGEAYLPAGAYGLVALPLSP